MGTVLILGASGRFGYHATLAFEQAGWTVRRFRRGIDDLAQSAMGSEIIVNAWNPPYPQWAADVPALHKAVRDAARLSGSRVIIPGNVYVFGADAPTPWSTKTPHRADTSLGRIRMDMETAYREDGVATLILRAGDFIDTRASGNWFDRIMTAKLAKGRFVYPGDPTVPHAWAYLPDLARAAVDLANMSEELPRFADIPYPGYTLTGRQLCQLVQEAAEHPIQSTPFGWASLRLLAPVWPMARCLVEMRYLWDTPHGLDGTVFRSLLPPFSETPPLEAIRTAIAPLRVGAM